MQWGHAHTCIFQVGNRLCVKRKHIHNHLDDQLLLQHVEELVVAVRQSRYLLPNEAVVGDHDARVRAHLHHFRRGQHQVAGALMEFWVVVDTHEYSSAAYARQFAQNLKQAVVLVVGVDLPLETLLVDAVVQRPPNVYRAVCDGLLPSAATLDRVDQS